MLCSECHESSNTLTGGGLCVDCHMETEERRFEIIQMARDRRQEEGTVEIDDNATLSEGYDNGCYIQAWVWVDFAGTRFDKEKETDADKPCDECGAKVENDIGGADGVEICRGCFEVGQH